MVFHWGLRDSKSPQVSMILLGILGDLNDTVIWMVSTCTLISKSSCPFINHLGDCIERTKNNWYHRHRHLHVSLFFLVLLQGLGTYLSLRFFSILLGDLPGRQSPLFSRFYFLCWLSLDLAVLTLLKNLCWEYIHYQYNIYTYIDFC